MKTSINGCVWGGYEDWKGVRLTADEFFAQVAEAGYDGIELGGGEKYLGTPKQCLERARRYGLEIGSYCTSVTYNPYPPNTRSYRQDMDYAADLGVKMLMVCGGFMPFGRRNTYGYDYDMFADNLGRAMSYAGRLGQTVAFHPHVGCIVETIAEAKEMVRRLPGFVLCVDTAHLARAGEDAVQFISTFRKRIVHAHIKDYSLKHNAFIELGKGDTLAVAACVHELQKVGYDGWLCVELDRPKSEFERIGKTAVESAKICRRYLKNKCGV
jgi:sugar phosphate isomerase/epimerase